MRMHAHDYARQKCQVRELRYWMLHTLLTFMQLCNAYMLDQLHNWTCALQVFCLV